VGVALIKGWGGGGVDQGLARVSRCTKSVPPRAAGGGSCRCDLSLPFFHLARALSVNQHAPNAHHPHPPAFPHPPKNHRREHAHAHTPNQPQSPLDVMLKCLLTGALILRPQIISRPASAVYDAVAALVGGTRARAEVARSRSSGGGAGRPSVWRAA